MTTHYIARPLRRLYSTSSGNHLADNFLTRSALQSSTFAELARASLIFNICRFDFIASRSERIYEVSTRLFGKSLVHALMKHTLYKHFCGGQTVNDVAKLMQRMKQHGVGAILDYAVEADVSTRLAEESYDENVKILLEEVLAVSEIDRRGFAAVKLSALGDFAMFEKMSTLLMELRRFYAKLTNPNLDLDQKTLVELERDGLIPPSIDFKQFELGWRHFFRVENDQTIKTEFLKSKPKEGKIDLYNFFQSYSLQDLSKLVSNCKIQGVLYSSMLNEEEMKKLDDTEERIKKIVEYARDLKVRVLVDAEATSVQPAIDHFVLSLQRRYNLEVAIVNQTYQTYLKSNREHLRRDLHRSREEGWKFGCKLVRGAYMVQEREIAQNLGRESPILETIEEVNHSYNSSVTEILEFSKSLTGLSLMIASHNAESIMHCIEEIGRLKLDGSAVSFAQLYGMSDNLTFPLGRTGYRAYKYVPYGPVDLVIPYLLRRATENSTLLGSPGFLECRALVERELVERSLPKVAFLALGLGIGLSI